MNRIFSIWLYPCMALLAALAACAPLAQPSPPPLPQTATNLAASARIDGGVGTPTAWAGAQVVYGRSASAPQAGASPGPGVYTLDFADADIREVIGQILGSMLGVTYAIDPAVHGTVTLHSGRALSRAELIPALQTLLAGNGAAMVSAGGVMRVVPAQLAGGAGSRVMPLQFVSAEELAKVLQPMVGANAHVAVEPALNALVLSGDAAQLDTIDSLIHSFDIDALAGQSYALLPVDSGSAQDFALALQDALRGRSGGSLGGLVRVLPLQRLGAVLVVAAQPRYIDAARRVYALVDQQRRATVRSWHVRYLQNSNADDAAYMLQTAFTPNNVTAMPRSQQPGAGGQAIQQQSLGGIAGGLGGTPQIQGGGGMAGGGATGGQMGNIGGNSLGGGNPMAPAAGSNDQRNASGTGNGAANATPQMLGGADNGNGNSDGADSMRILPNPQNNALLIYGTTQEYNTVDAMLGKLDIMPLQVRIDATIAEVTLNDQLQYGTQFFFKGGGINSILSTGSGPITTVANTVLNTTLPGFFIGGNGQGGAPFAITALQAVTTVNVLSSPQLVVVDNQHARLQVGSLVPYLTSTAQSTITSNAPLVSSIGYQPTGVIMDIVPRVNSGGLVTLDITQQVSDVDTTSAKSSGIDSPTFQQRIVTSRIAVQDGQTIGIAGLIRDNSSNGNQGLPWLKDIMGLGALVSTQNNNRNRTELLVLITPHVMRDQHEAQALTQDMRDMLRNAAAVPDQLQRLRPSGSNDPNASLIERVAR